MRTQRVDAMRRNPDRMYRRDDPVLLVESDRYEAAQRPHELPARMAV